MPLRQPSGRHGCVSSSSPSASSCRLLDEFYVRILPSRAWMQRELSTPRVHRQHGPGSGALEVINPLEQIRTSVWEVPSQRRFLLTQKCQSLTACFWHPQRKLQGGFLLPSCQCWFLWLSTMISACQRSPRVILIINLRSPKWPLGWTQGAQLPSGVLSPEETMLG